MSDSALKPCRVCEHKVAPDAQTCPSCGTVTPAAGVGMLSVQLVGYLMVLGAVGYGIYLLVQIQW